MAEKDDNRKLATTRLLDLLRSQQAGNVEIEEKQGKPGKKNREDVDKKQEATPTPEKDESQQEKPTNSEPDKVPAPKEQSPIAEEVEPSTRSSQEPTAVSEDDSAAEPPISEDEKKPTEAAESPHVTEEEHPPESTTFEARETPEAPAPEKPKFAPSLETQNKLMGLLAHLEEGGKTPAAKEKAEEPDPKPDPEASDSATTETEGPDTPVGEEEVGGDEMLGTKPIGSYLGKVEETDQESPEGIGGEELPPTDPESEEEEKGSKRREARNLLDRRKRFIDAEKSKKATDVIKAQLAEEAKEKSSSTEIEVDDEGWALPVSAPPDLFEMAESLAPSLQADQFSANLMRRITKSSRRLCLEVTDKGIRYIQARLGGTSIRVEKFGYIKVPFKLDETTVIRDMRTLTEVALPRVIGKKGLKKLYTSVYSQQFEGRTHFFQAPSALGRKDLSELVNWQATKNMNLGDGRGILRYDIHPSATASGKDHVVLVGADKEKTKQTYTAFRKAGMQIRYTSQLPVLLWNSFKKEYPDQAENTTILLHMQQSNTTLAVVHKGVLLSTREMSVGVEDFEAALEQKVNIDGKAVMLSREEAGKIVTDFGIPRKPAGKIKPHGLTLYRVSIFLRPVIERLTSEIQRSINFFKKQYNELTWDHIYISGEGGTIPNLSNALQENLGIEISLFNPIRAENIVYDEEEKTIPYEDLPLYTTLFALLNVPGNDEYNLLPDNIVHDQTLIPYATVSSYAAIFLVPIIFLTVVFEQMRADALQEELIKKEAPLRNISPKTEQYLGYQKDIRILIQYSEFLKTDSLKTRNYLKVMKFLSNVVPEEIRLTSLTIDRELLGGETTTTTEDATLSTLPASSFRDYAQIVGFVESDPSVADIRLTNFRMNLEKTRAFRNIKLNVNPRDKNQPNRLFFEMDCEF
ncbi:MAG: pilus assembly protein PilM [Candidatus Marinimicrobia bacterium]|nr:pilus assembly protein PilM [Candidatus Neomarinimicrobiota bacterium]MCF7839526.1 pilus assembly protein PilM [Candidatus Neomarinimicrobiota bacterium]